MKYEGATMTREGIDVGAKYQEIKRIVCKHFGSRLASIDPLDLVQEVCLAISRKNLQSCAFDPDRSSFSHYVYIVASSTVVNLANRDKRQMRAAVVDGEETLDVVDDHDAYGALEAAQEAAAFGVDLAASLDHGRLVMGGRKTEARRERSPAGRSPAGRSPAGRSPAGRKITGWYDASVLAYLRSVGHMGASTADVAQACLTTASVVRHVLRRLERAGAVKRRWANKRDGMWSLASAVPLEEPVDVVAEQEASAVPLEEPVDVVAEQEASAVPLEEPVDVVAEQEASAVPLEEPVDVVAEQEASAVPLEEPVDVVAEQEASAVPLEEPVDVVAEQEASAVPLEEPVDVVAEQEASAVPLEEPVDVVAEQEASAVPLEEPVDVVAEQEASAVPLEEPVDVVAEQEASAVPLEEPVDVVAEQEASAVPLEEPVDVVAEQEASAVPLEEPVDVVAEQEASAVPLEEPVDVVAEQEASAVPLEEPVDVVAEQEASAVPLEEPVDVVAPEANALRKAILDHVRGLPDDLLLDLVRERLAPLLAGVDSPRTSSTREPARRPCEPTSPGRDMTYAAWLRAEWVRSGLPIRRANDACGVKASVARKNLTPGPLWYPPSPEALAKLTAYANEHGDPAGRPYFVAQSKG